MTQQSMTYRAHPLADIFPLIHGDEFVALKSDIRENGLIESIVVLDGAILDGRNRFRACQEVGVSPRIEQYSGNDPLGYVISKNLKRRHMDESQRAMVGAKLANMPRGGIRDGNPNHANQTVNLPVDTITQSQAAELLNVSERLIRDAKAVASDDPELAHEIDRGVTTVTQAKRKIREREREKKRQDNREQIRLSAPDACITEVSARFSTIVIDPPWDWGDEGDGDQHGRARPDYHTMSIGQIGELPVAELALLDAHIYLWITNRSLPKGFSLLEKWGFRYITCLTWVKPSFGMGNYFRGQTEQVLFGVRGSLPLKRKDATTVFNAPRGKGGHSSKPDEFFSLVESCSHGPFLEMFSRSARPDWVTWGQNGLSHAA